MLETTSGHEKNTPSEDGKTLFECNDLLNGELISRRCTMLADFPITVLCAQVVVHTEHRAADGLLWADDHVAQGYTWSQGYIASVCPTMTARFW